jgi:predicted protein tyrosine phosphatase
LISEIVDHVFIGDAYDAKNWERRIICVLESRPESEPSRAFILPILKTVSWMGQLDTRPDGSIHADTEVLDLVADMIDTFVKREEDVLVHCGAGIERSPLSVVWYLHKKKGLSIEEAYRIVIAARPQVMNRSVWLDGE